MNRELLSLGEIAGRLGDALARSTADETELAWIETARDGAAARSLSELEPGLGAGRGRTILVRVREGRRRGSFRTGTGEPGEIAAGIRQAVAASRVAAPTAEPFPPEEAPSAAGGPPDPGPLWDDELAELGQPRARQLLAAATGAGEQAHLEWTRTRVVVLTSEGVDRRAEATSATVRVVAEMERREGGRPAGRSEPGAARGAGSAASSARSLGALDLEAVVQRTRGRRADAVADAPPPDGPLLFSQEAACELVSLLAEGLSSRVFEAEGSPLAGMLGEHVFSPAVDLVDDGLDPRGLPFPFDLLGRAKRRVVLIEGGVPRSPAVDQALSARLRLPVTPHSVGPDEARPTHLFLLPREDEAGVLAAAEGGVWIGALEGLECFDRSHVAARARVVGARRIEAGRFGEGLPELVWEDSLLRLFSRVLAVGGEPVRLADPAFLGGVSAPMVVVDGAEELRPA